MPKLRYLASMGSLILVTRAAALGCTPGGVGDPCVPEDEYSPTFAGFAETEVNVESRSSQCETRLCITDHFRGRVSCPYGQTSDYVVAQAANANTFDGTAEPGLCYIPRSKAQAVSVAVAPQLLQRRAEDTVYCSCRCDGPDKAARYCTCPSGYSCSPLVPDLGLGHVQLVGSYCLKDGISHQPGTTGASCSFADGNCPSDQASSLTRNPLP